MLLLLLLYIIIKFDDNLSVWFLINHGNISICVISRVINISGQNIAQDANIVIITLKNVHQTSV